MKKEVKRLCGLILAAVLLMGAAGCGGGGNTAATDTTAATAAETGFIVTDQAGREVFFEKPAEKIVSSYYISTAILAALGIEENIAGIEMKADTRGLYKAAAPGFLELPAVGSGKGINIEETAALSPDVVIIPQKLADSAEQFEKLSIPVIVVDPETMDNFKECIALLGQVCGAEERADALIGYYEEKMAFAEELTGSLEDRPKVYLAAGSSYLSTCTSKMYQNDLIRMAGGENVSAELQEGYWQEISPEQLLQWDPDYIFAVGYAEYTLDDIRNDARLSEVNAVKSGNIYTFPSALEPWDYPTPSSVLGILWLTHALHPELYSEADYMKEAEAFYRTFFDIGVSAAELGV